MKDGAKKKQIRIQYVQKLAHQKLDRHMSCMHMLQRAPKGSPLSFCSTFCAGTVASAAHSPPQGSTERPAGVGQQKRPRPEEPSEHMLLPAKRGRGRGGRRGRGRGRGRGNSRAVAWRPPHATSAGHESGSQEEQSKADTACRLIQHNHDPGLLHQPLQHEAVRKRSALRAEDDLPSTLEGRQSMQPALPSPASPSIGKNISPKRQTLKQRRTSMSAVRDASAVGQQHSVATQPPEPARRVATRRMSLTLERQSDLVKRAYDNSAAAWRAEADVETPVGGAR